MVFSRLYYSIQSAPRICTPCTVPGAMKTPTRPWSERRLWNIWAPMRRSSAFTTPPISPTAQAARWEASGGLDLSSARRVTCKADGRRSLLTTTRSKMHKAIFAPNKASMRPDARGERPTLSLDHRTHQNGEKSASMHYEFSQKSNKFCYRLKRFRKEKVLIFQGGSGREKGRFWRRTINISSPSKMGF